MSFLLIYLYNIFINKLTLPMTPSISLYSSLGFPGGSGVKASAWNAGDWVRSLGWEDPLRRRGKWQPTPVLLPGESHGGRSQVGYSPRGAKSRTRLSDFTFTFFSVTSINMIIFKFISVNFINVIILNLTLNKGT